MSKDPAVLFYTSDFLTGTMTMKDEHVGMYIRLLCLQHQKGALSKEDMLYICRTYVEDVFDKFIEKDGIYWNERMKVEADKRQKYSVSRRENVAKRYKKKQENQSTYVEHMENENENINILLLQVWNSKMPWKVAKLTKTRKTHLAERLKERMFKDNYEKILELILQSDFLLGKKNTEKHSNFKADFDWIIKNDTNYVKVLEGKYNSTKGGIPQCHHP